MTTIGRRNIGLTFILPGLLTFAFSSLHAQSIVVDPPITAPVTTLTVNDLDFLNATTPKWLFTISMRAEGTVDATMTINVDALLADGTSYTGAVSLTTDSFPINMSRTITNLDLVRRNPTVARYTVREDARRRFEETALPGGKVPAGMYRFIVTVTEVGSNSGTSEEFMLKLSNPTTVQLLSPANGEESQNEFPLFQWFYDGPRSRISIYEQLPGQSSSEEIASGVPQLTATLETNSYQYPTSGVRPLQPGKTYAWFVEGLTDVSGGSEVPIKSEIRSFRVPLPGGATSNLGFLEELEKALGPRHRGVFDAIRAQGLFPDGGITRNGSTISQSDLLQLINLFRSDPDAVSSVELE